MSRELSVIIPAVDEAQVLGPTLAVLQPGRACQVIVVDGGSRDNTAQLAEQAGCTTIVSPRGRGRQMNAGAALATGRILVFLHADTLLPVDFAERILTAVARPDFAAGAFSLGIASPDWRLAAIARLANLRSRLLHLPYGDQALFVTRSLFTSLGGFPELPIMEDYVFIRKARKRGRIVILPERVQTSPRRWQNIGPLRTTLINQLIVGGYLLGVDPVRLAAWYRRLRGLGRKDR